MIMDISHIEEILYFIILVKKSFNIKVTIKQRGLLWGGNPQIVYFIWVVLNVFYYLSLLSFESSSYTIYYHGWIALCQLKCYESLGVLRLFLLFVLLTLLIGLTLSDHYCYGCCHCLYHEIHYCQNCYYYYQ